MITQRPPKGSWWIVISPPKYTTFVPVYGHVKAIQSSLGGPIGGEFGDFRDSTQRPLYSLAVLALGELFFANYSHHKAIYRFGGPINLTNRAYLGLNGSAWLSIHSHFLHTTAAHKPNALGECPGSPENCHCLA